MNLETSRAPTSLDNLFALDLRAASLGATFDGAPEECYWSTLGDGTCDDENNNAYCGYDGEDCCVNTCASGSDDPCPLDDLGIQTDTSKCLSPVSVGSVDDAGAACSMDFILYDEDRRRLAGGDDDWSPGGDDYYFYDDYYGDGDRFDPVEDCKPAWPYAVRDESPDDSPEDGVYATTRGWHQRSASVTIFERF